MTGMFHLSMVNRERRGMGSTSSSPTWRRRSIAGCGSTSGYGGSLAAEHFVIPSEAEEWSGLGSRDIDGQAVGRVSGKRSSQSLTIPISVRIFGLDPGWFAPPP